jgi:hypothetical protein
MYPAILKIINLCLFLHLLGDIILVKGSSEIMLDLPKEARLQFVQETYV